MGDKETGVGRLASYHADALPNHRVGKVICRHQLADFFADVVSISRSQGADSELCNAYTSNIESEPRALGQPDLLGTHTRTKPQRNTPGAEKQQAGKCAHLYVAAFRQRATCGILDLVYANFCCGHADGLCKRTAENSDGGVPFLQIRAVKHR